MPCTVTIDKLIKFDKKSVLNSYSPIGFLESTSRTN